MIQEISYYNGLKIINEFPEYTSEEEWRDFARAVLPIVKKHRKPNQDISSDKKSTQSN